MPALCDKPDAGDLGNGVHAGGHQTRGGGRRQPERRERGAPALVRGRARERRRPDCIARGIYPGDVGLEALVDLDVTARADAELQAIQTDAVEIGDPPECGEYDIRGQRVAVRERHFDLREAVEARPADLRRSRGTCRPSIGTPARNPARRGASRNPSGSDALSTKVTAQPSAANIEAYSQAITPLPRTIRVRGIYGRLSTESLSRMCS